MTKTQLNSLNVQWTTEQRSRFTHLIEKSDLNAVFSSSRCDAGDDIIRLGKILESVDPILGEAARAVRHGGLCYLTWKRGANVEPLPDTPFRGQRPMFEVSLPDRTYALDLCVIALAAAFGATAVNVQTNIDAVDDSGWSPALPFHYDRGAVATILAALRGAANKVNVLYSVDAAARALKPAKFADLLCEARFVRCDRDYMCNLPFPVLTDLEMAGELRLSPQVVEGGLELNNIEAARGSDLHFEALTAFKNEISLLNRTLLECDPRLTSSDQPVANRRAAEFCLRDSDLVLINNASLFHGRRRAPALDTANNRWLRVAFLGRDQLRSGS